MIFTPAGTFRFDSGREFATRQLLPALALEELQRLAVHEGAALDLRREGGDVAARVEALLEIRDGLAVLAVLRLPRIEAPGTSESSRARAALRALEALGYEADEIRQITATCRGSLVASIRSREEAPADLVPTSGRLAPSAGAYEVAERLLGRPLRGDKAPIGSEELALRVAREACGSPVAYVLDLPEWRRLGQDGIDYWAALVICDVVRRG